MPVDKFGGCEGRVGKRGAAGPAGPAGAKGSRGEKGNPGSKGENGKVGSQGKVGPPGSKGNDGEKGDPGQKGETGPEGDSIMYRWFDNQVLGWFRENENCCFYFEDKNDFIWSKHVITGLKSHNLARTDAISLGEPCQMKTLRNGKLCIGFENSLFQIPKLASLASDMYITIAFTFRGDKLRSDKQYILTSSALNEHAVTLTANKFQVWGSTQDPIEFDYSPGYWNHVYIQWTNQGDRKGHVYYGREHKEFTTKMWETHRDHHTMYVGAKTDKQSPFYGDLAMLEIKIVDLKPAEKSLPDEIRTMIIESHKAWTSIWGGEKGDPGKRGILS